MLAPDYSHLLQNDEPRWSTARVASFWGVTTTFVSTAAKDGRIPGAFKAGSEWRFNPAIIRAMQGELPPPRDEGSGPTAHSRVSASCVSRRARRDARPSTVAGVHRAKPMSASDWADLL